MVKPGEIIFVSAHHPRKTYFAIKTRATFEKYTRRHGYGFYYDEEIPQEQHTHALHFRRCMSILKASEIYPDAKWFVWVDSDVYVNDYSIKVENLIDLDNLQIMYHVCHEQNWGCYPINTGVKFVNREALAFERTIWDLRNTHPWTEFPYEQKVTYEHIFPIIGNNRFIIHDPYVLNCIIKAYPEKIINSLFAHMCFSTEEERNTIMRSVYI